MSKAEEYFFKLIRISIGVNESFTQIPSFEEWQDVYEIARKQSLLGVCFYAISKLPEEQRPNSQLYFQWLSMAVQIQEANEHLDKQTSEIWQILKDYGLDSVILKGQGIAVLYDEALKTEEGKDVSLSALRQCGDIDIWVKGGYQKVCNFVQNTHPTDDLAYHRFHYDAFEDTEVELHHRPTLMRNLLDDRKLARWYNSFETDSFIFLEDKGFAVPSYEFNVIFILTHIYRHFLFEGVGLRQVMDYYFVLKSDVRCKKVEVTKTLQSLKLDKFARAVMWVMKTQFGLEDKYLISEPDEKEGSFLLNEILLSGNFGQTDQRYRYRKLFKLQRFLSRGSHLLIHYPSEILWSPIWFVYHWFWKRSKKYKIHKQRNCLSHKDL